MAKLLIDHGADVDSVGTYDYTSVAQYFEWTSLKYAIYSNFDMCVDLLLKSGADLSKVDFNGMTAIEYAKSKGYDNIIKLIEKYELPVKGVQTE